MTNVKWGWVGLVACFAVASAGAQVDFKGLTHTPTGTAFLVPLGPNLLEVFPGAVGGVSIDLTSVESATGTYSGLNPASIPSGQRWSAQTFAGGSLRSSFSVLDAGAVWDMTATFASVTNFEVELYVGDVLVDAQVGLSGNFGSTNAEGWEINYLETVGAAEEIEVLFSSAATVTLTGSVATTARRMVIRSFPVSPTLVYDTVEVEATTGVFFIEDATIGLFGGRQHRALGQALLAGSGCPSCKLTLSNIGATGNDGVSILLEDDADGLEVKWGTIAPISGAGAGRKLTGYGLVNGVPDVEFGSIAVDDLGTTLGITSEFNGIGGISKTIEVYDGATLVLSVPNFTGSFIGTVPDTLWPSGGMVSAREQPFLDPAFGLTFSGLTSITIPGNPAVTGDFILVSVENAVDDVLSITTVDDSQNDLPDPEVLVEEEDPFCNTDFDNSNNTDLSDLSVVLANFGQGAVDFEDGDANADTTVALDDLAQVLAEFNVPCVN